MPDQGSTQRLLLLLATTALPLLVSLPQPVHALTPGERSLASAPRLILGGEPEEGFGKVLASPGDITGDGLGDLLVGAPSAREGAGRVYLFSGADILSGAALRAEDAWATVEGGVGWGYGSEVEVLGDVDGDGWPDWGVGAPGFPGGDAPTGRLWVISGRRTVADVPVGELLSSDALVAFDGPTESALLGEGFAAAGDVNNDGLGDFALVHRDPDTSADSGLLHVVLGRARGNWPPAPSLADVSGWSYLVDGLGDPGLGFTLQDTIVAAGDRDNDGVGDLFFGMPGYTSAAAGSSARTGALALLLGLAPGEQGAAEAEAALFLVADTTLLGTNSVIDAHFGQPLAVADTVGGQVLWVGAEGPDRGRSLGLAISGIQLGTDDPTVLVAGTGVLGGLAVSRADLDGDGTPSLVAASPRLGEAPGTPGSGRVAVLRADVSGVVEISDSFAGFAGGDEFAAGSALAAANVDADDYDDVFVGAPGAFGVGAVFVLVGAEMADGDGVSPAGGDCDDAVATVFPGALEIGDCADNLDNDCNGLIDEADEPCGLEGSGIVVGCSAAGGSGGSWLLALLVFGLRPRARRKASAPRAARVGVLLVAGLGLLAGCVAGPLPEGVAPAIRIVSPIDEDRLPETSILPVVVEVDGVRLAAESAGEEPVEPGAEDPQLLPKALWALSVDGLYRSTDGGVVQVAEGLVPGIHIVKAELRDTADQPFVPEVSAEISVEIIAGQPLLALTNPIADAVLPPAGFEVRYEVGGFLLNTASIGSPNQLGVGHAVVRVDDVTVATDGDGRAFLTGVAAGEHTLMVELVNNDGSSLSPEVSESVEVTVAEPVLTVTQPLPDEVLEGPDIVIEYEVSNFTLDPINVNGTPEAGRGHTHVYLDGLYQGLNATGTFPVPAVTGCDHTLRLELAEAGHAELGIGVEVGFEVHPCVSVEGLTGGDTVVGPQVTIPFVTPGFALDGTTPENGGLYVTQYLDGVYVGFTTQPGNATYTGVAAGAHVFELRLAEGPVAPGSEQDGERSPAVVSMISLTVQ
ncbi:MAG: FG-GAP repeat protein [Deltaproteobacteria bacterium]|nr:FG-GAP repeat protein [Deltaproteobacteria bacterium]